MSDGSVPASYSSPASRISNGDPFSATFSAAVSRSSKRSTACSRIGLAAPKVKQVAAPNPAPVQGFNRSQYSKYPLVIRPTHEIPSVLQRM